MAALLCASRPGAFRWALLVAGFAPVDPEVVHSESAIKC
jgi:hypothetical protein